MGDFSVQVSGFGSNAKVDGHKDGTARWWADFGEGYVKDWGKRPGTFDVDPALENLSINDLLEQAEVGFNAVKVPTYILNPHTGQYNESTETFVTVRDDTWQEVGPRLGKDYTVIQHADALESVLGDVRDLGGVPTRVLAFNNGAKVTIQCALPGSFWVADSKHGLFLNLWNSHDGTGKIRVNTCDFRIVCANTYAMAKASDLGAFFAKHTKNVGQRLNNLARAAGIIQREYTAYAEQLFNLSQKPVTSEEVTQFLNLLVPDPEKKDGQRQNVGPQNRRAEIGLAILSGAGNRQVTAYDLFQGVTGYVDRREQNRNGAEQFIYATIGVGQNLKDAAWNILTAGK